ncbi:MAG: hypothetical protein WD767_15860 [Alphaproteobacteria bacterium]
MENTCPDGEAAAGNGRGIGILAPIAALAILAASCGGTESVFALGAGLASFVHTDKLPTDYVAEYASGKQCNLLKSLEDGGPLCRDSFERNIIEKPIYCYRTIGEPTCYATPDPYGVGARQIQ